MPTIAELRQNHPEFEGVSDDGIFNYLQQEYPQLTKFDLAKRLGYEIPGSDVGRGFSDTGAQLKQAMQGVGAAVGAAGETAFGEGGFSTAIKEKALEGYRETESKLQDSGKPSDSFNYSVEALKQGEFGPIADWAQYAGGQAIGQGLSALATAGIGGKAAQVIAPALAKRLIESEASRLAATEAGKDLTADVIQEMATKAVKGKLERMGANTALGAYGFGQEGGEIGGGLVDKASKEGRTLTPEEHINALLYTGIAGGMEFVQDRFGLDLIQGKFKPFAGASGIGGLNGRMARGTIGGALAAPAEGAVEYGQTLAEEAGKGNDPFSPEARAQAFDAAAMGAVGGGVMGGAGGMLSKPLPKIDGIANAQNADEAIKAAASVVNEGDKSGQQSRPSYEDYMQRDTAPGGRYREKARLGYDGQAIEGELLDPDTTIGQARAALPPGYIDAEGNPVGMLGQQRRLTDQKKLQGPETNAQSAPNYRLLGDFVGKGEGSYTSVNKGTANGKIVGSGTQDGLINMTVGEVKALQQKHVQAQKNGIPGEGLFAVGKYQFIPGTFDRAAAKAGLKDTDLFSPLNQEKMFLANLPDKVKGYLNGSHNDLDGAVEALAKEWASIPSVSKNGNSYYGEGNKASHSLDQARQALIGARNGGGQLALPGAETSTVAPTHETNDGIPLWHNPEDDSYQDAEGNYWGEEDATPITQTRKKPYTQEGASEQGQQAKNEAAFMPPRVPEEAAAATVADVVPPPAPGGGNPSPTQSFRNDALEAFVTPNTDGKRFNVSVRDMESGEFFHEEGRIFKNESDAVNHAQKILGISPTQAQQQTPPPTPTLLTPEKTKKLVKLSPTPDINKFNAGTVRDFSHLLPQNPEQALSTHDLADAIAAEHGLKDPKIRLAVSALKNTPPKVVVRAVKAAKPYKRPPIKPTDELKQVISKFGGLKYTGHADRAGFTDYKLQKHQQAFNLFHNGTSAKTLDEMAELLREKGFHDIDGENTLIEKLYNSLNGAPHYTPEGFANYAATQAAYHEEGLSQQEADIATELDEAIDESAVDESVLDDDPFDEYFESKVLSQEEANAFWGLDEDKNGTDTGKTTAIPAGSAKSDTGSGETATREAQSSPEDDFLTPYSPTAAKTAKPKPTGATLDLFASPDEQKRLAEKQKIHDLIKKKDEKLSPDAPSGGELFQQAAIQGQQDVADIGNEADFVTKPTKPDLKTENKQAEGDIRSKVARKISSIKELVALARARKDGNRLFADIGGITPDVAEKVEALTGKDVSGWVHGIDEAAVRHTFKKHGNSKSEASRGQIAVTNEDFDYLPEILNSPDDIRHGKEDGTIEISKRIGHQVFVVQALRTGSKKLALVTMWKKPLAARDAPQNESPAETSETFGKRTSSDGISLSQVDKKSLSGNTDQRSAEPLTPDELKLSYQLHNEQIIEAIGPDLHKAAGVASQREFDSLPFKDQQGAYVAYVDQGGDPVLSTDATMTVKDGGGNTLDMPIAEVMADIQQRKAALEKYLDCARAA